MLSGDIVNSAVKEAGEEMPPQEQAGGATVDDARPHASHSACYCAVG